MVRWCGRPTAPRCSIRQSASPTRPVSVGPRDPRRPWACEPVAWPTARRQTSAPPPRRARSRFRRSESATPSASGPTPHGWSRPEPRMPTAPGPSGVPRASRISGEGTPQVQHGQGAVYHERRSEPIWWPRSGGPTLPSGNELVERVRQRVDRDVAAALRAATAAATGQPGAFSVEARGFPVHGVLDVAPQGTVRAGGRRLTWFVVDGLLEGAGDGMPSSTPTFRHPRVEPNGRSRPSPRTRVLGSTSERACLPTDEHRAHARMGQRRRHHQPGLRASGFGRQIGPCSDARRDAITTSSR